MSDSLIQVPFHGDTIEAVAKNDTWMASLRRMCETSAWTTNSGPKAEREEVGSCGHHAHDWLGWQNL